MASTILIWELRLNFPMGFTFISVGRNNDQHEIGTGKYIPIKRLTPYKEINATKRWSSCLHSIIQDFEVIYVNEEWKIPAQCTFSFINSEKFSIVLGGELNKDNSLPLPLQYEEICEIYVFHDKNLPEIKWVELFPPDYLENEANNKQYDTESDKTGCSSRFIGGIILFIFLVIILIKMGLDR
ncbi:hypothetical protein [Brumimicrobium mesophilum]|uniref:hypothetical protein n=1 Tax=Brumimicrobium mesophilum TaxID=392717 RepID=UPI000D143951|nr:hypothetical protein [Brumimicrobium mesophilum]